MRFPRRKILRWKRDAKRAVKMVRHAIDHGVNYVDTAYVYNQSEEIVGAALAGGYREKVKLVNKLPVWRVKDQADVAKFLDESLARCRTDHFDLYLFHALSRERFRTVQDLDLFTPMEEARASGTIKHVGFSFHDSYPAFKEIVDAYPWEMCQVQYNYVDHDAQATTRGLEYAASKNMAVVVMEPVKGGKLADPPAEIRAMMDQAPVSRTSVDWALQFVWNRPEVSCVLSGMSSMQQVQENLASADHSGPNHLTPAELRLLAEIKEYYRQFLVVPCSTCGYCMPCPRGVNIPEHFAIVNQLAETKDAKRARKRLAKLVTEPGKLNADKTNGAAGLCVECGQCAEKCPQAIPIPETLKKVEAVVKGARALEDAFPA